MNCVLSFVQSLLLFVYFLYKICSFRPHYLFCVVFYLGMFASGRGRKVHLFLKLLFLDLFFIIDFLCMYLALV